LTKPPLKIRNYNLAYISAHDKMKSKYRTLT